MHFLAKFYFCRRKTGQQLCSHKINFAATKLPAVFFIYLSIYLFIYFVQLQIFAAANKQQKKRLGRHKVHNLATSFAAVKTRSSFLRGKVDFLDAELPLVFTAAREKLSLQFSGTRLQLQMCVCKLKTCKQRQTFAATTHKLNEFTGHRIPTRRRQHIPIPFRSYLIL